jgi:hypothetical protein
MHGENRRRRWYENEKHRRIRNTVLAVTSLVGLLLVLCLFYEGMHTPTLYISHKTRQVVEVKDSGGRLVRDEATRDQILRGRYDVVWVP